MGGLDDEQLPAEEFPEDAQEEPQQLQNQQDITFFTCMNNNPADEAQRTFIGGDHFVTALDICQDSPKVAEDDDQQHVEEEVVEMIINNPEAQDDH